jgi:translation initiation factor IF-2
MNAVPLLVIGGLLLFAGGASASTSSKGAGPAALIALANKLVSNLISRKYDYDRALCKSFQKAAGITADGIYGPATRTELAKYVAAAPAALFKGAAPKGTPAPAAKKPPLPKKPLGSPPAPVYLVPGTPPKGGAVPGSAPKGATAPKPGNKPPAKKVAKPLPPGARKPPPLPVVPKVPPVPVASVKASPVLEPNRGSTPAGYSPATARARARGIAAHLAKKGPASYSRAELATWQKQAALKPDGLYGGSSRGALIFYGVADPPRPFSAPVATLQYVPPEQRK